MDAQDTGASPMADVRLGHRRPLLGATVAVSCLPGAALVGTALLRGGMGVDLCFVHATTGRWCPLCGGTRATRALIHGDLATAVGYNPFALAVEAVVVVLLLRWLLVRRAGRTGQLLSTREAVVLFAAAAVFGVVRNLPGMWTILGPLLGSPG